MAKCTCNLSCFLHAAKILEVEFVVIGLAYIMSGGLNNFGKQESSWKVSLANKNPF